jgi:hypothetical protein
MTTASLCKSRTHGVMCCIEAGCSVEDCHQQWTSNEATCRGVPWGNPSNVETRRTRKPVERGNLATRRRGGKRGNPPLRRKTRRGQRGHPSQPANSRYEKHNETYCPSIIFDRNSNQRTYDTLSYNGYGFLETETTTDPNQCAGSFFFIKISACISIHHSSTVGWCWRTARL